MGAELGKTCSLPPYRLSHSDHTKQLHHVGVPELAHDGRLLEELDLILLCRLIFVENLQCNLTRLQTALPLSSVHCSKLTTPNFVCPPVHAEFKLDRIYNT